jgi:four helix bundle protein
MQDHTKLSVWHRARSLAVAVHEVSQSFAGGSAPGLRTQMLRAAMSISTNVAEGAARDSRLDFARFVSIAAASASEVEHHLTVAGDFGLIEEGVQTRLVAKVVEVRRMLVGLRRALLAREAEDRARWDRH